MMSSPIGRQEGSLPIDPAKTQSTFLGGGFTVTGSSVKHLICSGIFARIIVYLNGFYHQLRKLTVIPAGAVTYHSRIWWKQELEHTRVSTASPKFVFSTKL
ncbi:hypothetical protein K440DRAFT_619050 [Wilcoxina mikolae CBS 423.85]|nr:hypothetical protein K440DRAFT_619050 [Wilcoxina mikolae CBS 423.85]